MRATDPQTGVAALDSKTAVAVLPLPEPVRGKPISAAAIRRAAAPEEQDTWDLVKGLLGKSSFQVRDLRVHSWLRCCYCCVRGQAAHIWLLPRRCFTDRLCRLVLSGPCC